MKGYKTTRKILSFTVNDETYRTVVQNAKKQQLRIDEYLRRLLYRDLSGLKRID